MKSAKTRKLAGGGISTKCCTVAQLISSVLPYMFSYTRHLNVPKTSNSIESFFGHLKDHLRLHRRLSDEHFKDFVKWYLFLQSNQDKLTKNNGENN